MIGWPVALAFVAAGAVIALVMGQGWVARRFQPLATFVLALFAISAVVSLNEYWRQEREAEEQRASVVATVREMRAELVDYRHLLASAIPAKEGGVIAVNRVVLKGERGRLPRELLALLHERPNVLKHMSVPVYEEVARLTGRMDQNLQRLDAADDEGFARLVTLLERDVELLDKVLAWEGIYQQKVLTFEQLSRFIEQLERKPAEAGSG